MYKIKFGSNPFGSYCSLYKRFLFIYWLKATITSRDHTNGRSQASDWQKQYNVPDHMVKCVNV